MNCELTSMYEILKSSSFYTFVSSVGASLNYNYFQSFENKKLII